MNRVNVYASWPHYVEHTAPIFAALPARRRGLYMVAGQRELDALAALGLKAKIRAVPLELAPGPVLVAAVGERRAVAAKGYTRIALMEHGAGQSYGGQRLSGESSSYAGGASRDAYGLFLHPNEQAAARDRARYPRAEVAVIGSPAAEALPRREPGGPLTLAVTFHGDMNVCEETRWAFPWIRNDLRDLVGSGDFAIIGTGHPRAFADLVPWYRKVGIEPVASFAEVSRRADVLMFDNTSAGFAFAATGRNVVVLNPPTYRLAVDHGLRFQRSAGCPITAGPHFCGAAHVGVQVHRRPQLAAAVAAAFAGGPELEAQREAALGLVYTYRTGSAKRAAAALASWAG